MKLFFAPVLVSLFLYNFCFAQSPSLQLTESLVIGEDQSSETAYMFGTPDKIQVDPEGNIYVSDRSDNTIRVFNQNGEYQHSIGGRGRGPGEFLLLQDFKFDSHGNLIVLDRSQSKVSTFKPGKELLKEESLPADALNSAFFIFPTQKDQYLLAFHYLAHQEPNSHFLHLFDSSFKNKISEHFDLFETYFDASIPIEARFAKSPWYHSTRFGPDNHKIAISHDIHTGSIYIFDIESLSVSQFGHPDQNPYEELNWQQSNQIQENSVLQNFLVASGRSGNFFLRKNATDFGLVGNQDFLLQFYGSYGNEDVTPELNIYSKNGILINNIRLLDAHPSFIREDKTFSLSPKFLDNNNKLYVIDSYYDDSYPAIRVFETNLAEFLEE